MESVDDDVSSHRSHAAMPGQMLGDNRHLLPKGVLPNLFTECLRFVFRGQKITNPLSHIEV
jgi:hypothetical protein